LVVVLLNDRRFMVLAVAAALLARLAYGAMGTPIAWPDTFFYMEAGRQLLAGQLVSSHLVMPLYPLFLATVGWDAAPAAQALLSAATLPLVYLLAFEIFERRSVARWAAALMVVEPLSVFYANQRMSETLFMFLLCAALLALYRCRPLLSSVLLVASILVRPTIGLLAPALMALFCLREARGRRAVLLMGRRVALYGLVYVVLMSPWWWHNWQKYGRFVHLNLSDGIVLRMENNPVFVELGFWKQLDFVLNEFADETDPVARNRKRRDAALAFIREDPLRYAGLSLRRLGRFWSPVIDQESVDIGFVKRARAPFFIAECVIYLGVLGYAFQRQEGKWRRIAPLLLVIGYFTAVHTAMNAVVRYRAPLMPLVVIIAAAGWQRATQRLGRPQEAAQAAAPSRTSGASADRRSA
jgi:4-amino-4-deoxy-L-arabinose transferase-like glycosyltransferase